MKDDWKQVFPVEPSSVTAINILPEPDATMLQRSEANNACLLEVFPKGFALDATQLQQDLIDAVAPFTLAAGLSNAFATSPDDPVIDPLLIDYVSTFVSKSSGEHFDPHVTTGITPRDYLDTMLAEPFEPFTFSPAGAAVYQLGHFGTAAKKLHEWELKR